MNLNKRFHVKDKTKKLDLIPVVFKDFNIDKALWACVSVMRVYVKY